MSHIRLYVDEDAEEHAVVQGLRVRGVDLLTTSEAQRLGATDAEQLPFAAALRRTLYSFNVGDFASLHREYLRQGMRHFGVVVIPDQRCSVGEKVRRVAAFVSRLTADEMVSRMEYL